MTTTTSQRKTPWIILGLAIGLLFLIACSTQPTTPTGAANAPTGAQTSFSEGDQVARSAFGNGSLVFADNSLNTGIHVSGRGQASATPDLATLNLGVESFAGSVQQARNDTAAAMDQVLSVLRSNGIAEEDLQTSFFNISPRYSNREMTRCVDRSEPKVDSSEGLVQQLPEQECFQEYQQVITGYQVSNQLSVQVRDLDNVGNVIDAVTEAGGDLIRFRGVNFSIEDTQELQEKARAAAVADMQNKASQLADLTGRQLGAIISISETSSQAPLMVAKERASFDAALAASVPTQILGGELDVTVTVQGVYAIQ
ncbi:MAG: SIMPL domain-containing protein [Dehalococcoidia bacterium]